MSHSNTKKVVHWWNNDEDIHRFTIDAEYIGFLKLGIETDTFGNKDVYRYRGYSMVEETEITSYGFTYSPVRVTASNIGHYSSETGKDEETDESDES
jgi:hypothetical protein